MQALRYIGSVLLLVVLLQSCGNNSSEEQVPDNFDRQAMLTFWADDIIMPGLENYTSQLDGLVPAKDAFLAEPDNSTLEALQLAYLDAYRAWQRVSFFDIGKAEEISLTNFTNIHPVDEQEVMEHMVLSDYDLTLPSTNDAQGFPALDYMLYGMAEELQNSNFELPNGYGQYLDDVVTRLSSMASEVLIDWEGDYRKTFIDNDGSSATASVDKLINDYLFSYERFLRAGKVGIPAGVFSNAMLPDAVEGLYSEVYSKELFLEGLSATRDFFVGVSFDGSTSGTSLQDYVTTRSQEIGIENIATDILGQFDIIESRANSLDNNFRQQVLADNIQMLETYDEMQKMVVLLKVDMLQALNVQVDFIDADGD